MLNIAEQKKEIREQWIKKRKAFPETACAAKSRAIEKRVLASSEFASTNVIHFYLSDRFEVQTDALIQESLRLGKRVVVPAPSKIQIALSEMSDPTKRVSPEAVDLWIIPAVACDTMGHRLGRGRGYYDRLLAGCVGKIICLAFEFQVVASLPFEKTDRNVDMIMTEDRTIICGVEKCS